VYTFPCPSAIIILLRWFPADNLFYLDPHRTRATIPLWPRSRTTTELERERGIPIRQSAHLSHPRPSLFADVTRIESHRPITFSYPTASPSPLPKWLSTSGPSSGGAHVRWTSAGANGARLVLSSQASDAGLDPTQVHYVTSYSAAELRTFHSERVRKMPLLVLDPSMLIEFLCKTEANWIDLRRRVAEV
jgi:cysteine protease ATG4